MGQVLYYSVYLLYWYKSTNTDEAVESWDRARQAAHVRKAEEALSLAEKVLYYSVYLIYWYKRTTYLASSYNYVSSVLILLHV
jgi:hypothetical protein